MDLETIIKRFQAPHEDLRTTASKRRRALLVLEIWHWAKTQEPLLEWRDKIDIALDKQMRQLIRKEGNATTTNNRLS